MSVQPSVHEAAAATSSTPAVSTLMHRHNVAKARLESALQKQRSVAVMVGADSFELSRIIAAFAAGLGPRTTAVRLRQPQQNALAAFGEITRDIGFDPKDLTLSDLQNLLTLFLEYQCKHRHRTVLCVEKADQQSKWLLESIARLVDSTESTPIGQSLLVVLTGSTGLCEVLHDDTFEVLRKKGGLPIRLAPLTIFETREFLRQMSNSADLGEIQSLFEFDAVERLHRLSGGVPCVVARLFRECLAIVDKREVRTATPEIVAKAARNLRASLAIDEDSPGPRPAVVPQPGAKTRRLLIQFADRPPREFTLEPGRYMVGRAGFADIHLPSLTVSRRHALLIVTDDGVQVLDVGSTNGILMGGERVSEIALEPDTPLQLGNCQIEYQVN